MVWQRFSAWWPFTTTSRSELDNEETGSGGFLFTVCECAGVCARYMPGEKSIKSLLKVCRAVFCASLLRGSRIDLICSLLFAHTIAIVDFKKPADQARFFVIDLVTGKVEALKTSHGRGSDDPKNSKMAVNFSDKLSRTSTLGLFKVSPPEHQERRNYSRSRISGMDSTNKNAAKRALSFQGGCGQRMGAFCIGDDNYKRYKDNFANSD